MNLILKTRSVEVPESLAQDIERRVRLVLGRFGRKIAHVTVRFADVNGTRGGVDKLCRVEARVWGRLPLAAEGVSDDLRTAAVSAVDRIGRVVERAVGRRFASPKDFPFRNPA